MLLPSERVSSLGLSVADSARDVPSLAGLIAELAGNLGDGASRCPEFREAIHRGGVL
jgi:hypothetical protein